MTIQELRNRVEQQKGRRSQIQESIINLKERISENGRSLQRHEDAREIIREVGLRTQQELQFHISDIASLALEAVYDDPYQLKAEFVQRRNKTECDLYFERDGERVEPMDASGGGTVNIASFALRVASWTMQHPKSNNVLILDEPFLNISTDLLPRASDMIKQVSERLGLQLIIVTHSDELIESADRTFEIQISKGVSYIKEG